MRDACRRSAIRRPVRMLLLLLLIGAISFVCVSQGTEALVVSRELVRLEGYYRAIGTLKPEDDTVQDVTAGKEAVESSSYVDFGDSLRYCSGVLQGLYNGDLNGRSSDYAGVAYPVGVYASDVWLYGELRFKTLDASDSSMPRYRFTLQVDGLEAGYPDYVRVGDTVTVTCAPEEVKTLEKSYDSLRNGERYFFRVYYNPSLNPWASWKKATLFLSLRPLYEKGLYFFPVKPGETVNFDDPAWSGIREELAVQEENRHAVFIIGTKDQSAMPNMQEASRFYHLSAGRWLNREDDLESRRVCVVHRDFAEMVGLSMGDTITLKLRDLRNSYYGYISSGEDRGNWREYETQTETFEIVGLYDWPGGGRQTTSSSLWVYLPDSCLPKSFNEWRTTLEPSSCSFVLRSPRDKAAFLSDRQAALARLGYQIVFLDDNWESFAASAASLKLSSAMSAIVFAVVLLLTSFLVVFLYLRQQRREFALLRALGVSKRSSVRQLLCPFLFISAGAVILGGGFSWGYALNTATQNLRAIQKWNPESVSVTLSPLWLLGFCCAILLLLFLIAWIGARGMARRPVFELLQNTARSPKKHGRPPVVPAPEQIQSMDSRPPDSAVQANEILPPGKKPPASGGRNASAFRRYLLRQARRSPLRSGLILIVTLCFLLAIGWMDSAVQKGQAELQTLASSVRVQGEIRQKNASVIANSDGGIIYRRTVDAILKSGFVQKAYLEAGATSTKLASVDAPDAAVNNVALRAFDQPEEFLAGTGKSVKLEYADGWDDNLFRGNPNVVILPVSLREQLGVALGDSVQITGDLGTSSKLTVAGQYTGELSGNGAANVALLPLAVLEEMEGSSLRYAVARFDFDPAKNLEFSQFRTEMDELFSKGDAGRIAISMLLWDEELRQVIEPLEQSLLLLSILYPVTVVVAILIAGGMAALLTLQAVRDAAVLRILGTTKKQVRGILCGEQLLLCVLGVLLGFLILSILWASGIFAFSVVVLICAVLYGGGSVSGALLAAASILKRSPLELLQEKE